MGHSEIERMKIMGYGSNFIQEKKTKGEATSEKGGKNIKVRDETR